VGLLQSEVLLETAQSTQALGSEAVSHQLAEQAENLQNHPLPRDLLNHPPPTPLPAGCIWAGPRGTPLADAERRGRLCAALSVASGAGLGGDGGRSAAPCAEPEAPEAPEARAPPLLHPAGASAPSCSGVHLTAASKALPPTQAADPPGGASPGMDPAGVVAEEEEGWAWEEEEEEGEEEAIGQEEMSAEDFVEKLRAVAQIAVKLARVQYAPAAQASAERVVGRWLPGKGNSNSYGARPASAERVIEEAGALAGSEPKIKLG
ncbi:hypothetical protein T484DRAFT_1857410, partial [Baffinella frigidus]